MTLSEKVRIWLQNSYTAAQFDSVKSPQSLSTASTYSTNVHCPCDTLRICQLLQFRPSARFSRVLFITSAEEGGYVFGSVCLSVCLCVRWISRKLVNGC